MSLTGDGALVRMPRWLLVVTVALSLATLLLIANLPDSGSDSDNFKLNLEMPSVGNYVWMGCQSGRPAGKALFFAGYKFSACQSVYVPLRSQQCVQQVALWHPPGNHLVQNLRL